MGIQDINKFLDDKNIVFRSTAPLKCLSGHRIAIDSCNWIYTYMSTAYKQYLNSGEFSMDENIKIIEGEIQPLMLTFKHENVFKILLSDLFSFIALLAENNITPVFVWDGEHPFDKTDTKKKRVEDREARLNTADTLALGLVNSHILKRNPEDLKKWKSLVQTSLRLPSKYFKEIRKTIRSLGFVNLTALADAEKLCAELNFSGRVGGIWSRDTDLYALGAPTMITRISDFEFEFVQTEDIRKGLEEISGSQWNIEKLRDFCITLGCDFNKRIPKMGPVNTFKMFCEFGSLDSAQENKTDKDWDMLNIDICRELLTADYENLEIPDLDWQREKFQKCAMKRLDKYGFKSLLPMFREAVGKIKKTI